MSLHRSEGPGLAILPANIEHQVGLTAPPTPPAGSKTTPRMSPSACLDDGLDPGRTTPRPSGGTITPPPIRGRASHIPVVVPGYEIGEEIARGGMGVIYLAREITLDRAVAIKTILPGSDGPLAARRFLDEARITARLPHPGIPPVYAIGALPDGRPFMAMKLIRGRALSHVLAARDQRLSSHSSEGLELTAPCVPGLLQVFEQIGQAVAFAHAEGVIHRDLKPQNVMLGTFGEVQVLDWGLARDTRAAPGPRPGSATSSVLLSGAAHPALTRTGEAMGTPAYMPPEQARGEWDRVDARADVFALGGILCTILTGRPPFTGGAPEDVVRRSMDADLTETFDRLDHCEASAGLVALAKMCLVPDPAQRPADAGVVLAALYAYRTTVEELW